MKRLALIVFLTPIWTGCGPLRTGLGSLTHGAAEHLARSVTITRDQWGVPYIHGRSDAAVAFGVAWAMAEDNYWQIEEDYLADLGRAAHWYGEGRVAADLARAALEVERYAREEYAREPEARRRIWDAYAQGLNYYLARHPQVLRRIIGHYEPWMVLARYRVAGVVDGLRLEPTGGDGLAVPGPPGRNGAGRAWAVAPAAGDRGAVLVASRSAPFFGRGQLYELHLRSDEGWHVRGVAELGTPFPSAGLNDRYAWTPTTDGARAGRLVRVCFDHSEDSLAYRRDGEWRRAEAWTDSVRVNTASGVETRRFTLLRTELGPVIARRGDTAFVAAPVAAAAAGWYELSRATSLAAFRAALGVVVAGGHAVAAADAEGNILFADGAGQVLNPAGGLLVAGVEEDGLEPAAAALPDSAALEALAFDTRVLAPDRAVSALVHEWEQIGALNTRRAAALDDAIELLRQWDGRVTLESEAATLYVLWREQAARAAPGSYLEFRALEETVAQLQRDWGTERVAWGELHRLLRTHTSGTDLFRDDAASLALPAVPRVAGAAFTAEYEPDGGRRRFARAGTAWIAVLEPGPEPRARTIVPFGQSADPASAHFTDQAAWYAGGRLKAAWFMPEDVAARAVRSYAPGSVRTPGETGVVPRS